MNRFALALLLSASSACAQQPDSGDRFETLFGFELNQTNLGAIERALGPAERFEVPDSHREFAICYQLPQASTIVTFISGREFGLGEELLLGFSVDSTNASSFPCSRLRGEVDQPTVAGLRLGMTEREFRTIVGDPVRAIPPNSLDRLFVTERKLTEQDYSRMSVEARQQLGRDSIDVTLGVGGIFQAGVLVSFSVHRVETF
jgi:hypothetical protein